MWRIAGGIILATVILNVLPYVPWFISEFFAEWLNMIKALPTFLFGLLRLWWVAAAFLAVAVLLTWIAQIYRGY